MEQKLEKRNDYAAPEIEVITLIVESPILEGSPGSGGSENPGGGMGF